MAGRSFLFVQQPLVDGGGGNPDGEAGREYDPQIKLFAEAKKCDEKEQNARQNSPQSAFGVINHQVEIAGVVSVQPEEHDKACQWHHSDKACQGWQLFSDLCAENDNGYTNQ